MDSSKFFRKEVLDLPAYHLDELPGTKLNQNESPWDIPVDLKALIIENLLKTPWNRYPLGDIVLLKKKLAKILGVWPDNIAFANGSNVLIQAFLLATAVGKNVQIVDPSFSVYEIEANLLGNTVHRFPLNPKDFSLDAPNFIKEMKRIKPKIIFIPNPNAPTGNMFELASIRAIIEAATCPVVIDEAYYPFSGTTILEWTKNYEHLAVLRTFSKAYALGGLRLGYLVADTEVIRQVEKCLLPFCVSKITIATALTVLDHTDYMHQYVDILCLERQRVYEGMQKIEGITIYPSATNFIFFEVPDAQHTFKELVSQGVVIRQINDGRRLTNALRVSIGSPEENDRFLKTLANAV
jgi:histidinol-phosphate aminotransferase